MLLRQVENYMPQNEVRPLLHIVYKKLPQTGTKTYV